MIAYEDVLSNKEVVPNTNCHLNCSQGHWHLAQVEGTSLEIRLGQGRRLCCFKDAPLAQAKGTFSVQWGGGGGAHPDHQEGGDSGDGGGCDVVIEAKSVSNHHSDY